MARGDGRIYLQPGTSMYSMSYYLNGKEHRESTKKRDPEEAAAVLRAKMKEVHAAQIGAITLTTAAMKKITVENLLDNLNEDFKLRGKASRSNLSTIKIAKESFGDVKAIAFGPAHVNKFISEKLADKYANASINRITGIVAQAFGLAVQENRLTKVPFVKHLSESENARQGFTDAATFAKIRENLPADLRDFCEFAFLTGWRKGEVAGLDWSNVQDNDTMIRLRPEQAKNKHGRSVPITGALVDIIKRRREARKIASKGTTQLCKLVFHREGRAIIEFRKRWASACKKAGCAGLIFHDLRRSAVSAMIQARVPQLVAMQISGHRTASMFHRYGIVVEDQLRDAMAATAAYHAEQQQKQAQQSNVAQMSRQQA